MVTDLGIFISLTSLLVTVAAVIGGWFAFRVGLGKQSSAIQAQTIDALSKRVEALESEREGDKQEIARLRQIINTVRVVLKRLGFHIQIDGDYVTITDATGGTQGAQGQRAKIKPVPLVPVDKDDDAV